MKLLMCKKCGDMFNLDRVEKSCRCGETSGRYVDDILAEIKGDCVPIGIGNYKFKVAYQMQQIEDQAQKDPVCCDGVPFDAFFIPENATSIKRIKK